MGATLIANIAVTVRDIVRKADGLDEWLPKQTIQNELKRPVFANNFPQEVQDSTSFTSIRVEEILSQPTSFGGDHASALKQYVTLQIWYAKNANYEDFEWKLNQLLESNGFYQTDSTGHQSDTETGQMETILTYNTIKNKRGN